MECGTFTKKETVDCFNDLLIDFVSACEPLFRGSQMENDLAYSKTVLKTLVLVNITVPIEQYLLHAYTQYGSFIDNNDIDGLLKLDYTKSAHDADVDISKILNVTALMVGISNDNRLVILEYLQMLNRLSERYYELNKK